MDRKLNKARNALISVIGLVKEGDVDYGVVLKLSEDKFVGRETAVLGACSRLLHFLLVLNC